MIESPEPVLLELSLILQGENVAPVGPVRLKCLGGAERLPARLAPRLQCPCVVRGVDRRDGWVPHPTQKRKLQTWLFRIPVLERSRQECYKNRVNSARCCVGARSQPGGRQSGLSWAPPGAQAHQEHRRIGSGEEGRLGSLGAGGFSSTPSPSAGMESDGSSRRGDEPWAWHGFRRRPHSEL